MLVVVFLLRVGLLTNFRPVICLTYLHVVCGRCCGCGGCRGYKVLPLLLLCILAIDAAWMFSNQFFGQKYASKISRFQYIYMLHNIVHMFDSECLLGGACVLRLLHVCTYVRTDYYAVPRPGYECVRAVDDGKRCRSKQATTTNTRVRTYVRTHWHSMHSKHKDCLLYTSDAADE